MQANTLLIHQICNNFCCNLYVHYHILRRKANTLKRVQPDRNVDRESIKIFARATTIEGLCKRFYIGELYLTDITDFQNLVYYQTLC